MLDITYKNRKIERICTNAKVADREYGSQMSAKIHMRIDEIRAVDTVEEMIQFRIGRCHALKGNRKGQYAVDLEHPYRLVLQNTEMKLRLLIYLR